MGNFSVKLFKIKKEQLLSVLIVIDIFTGTVSTKYFAKWAPATISGSGPVPNIDFLPANSRL